MKAFVALAVIFRLVVPVAFAYVVIPRRVALRQCKYLNNVIEQDHRTVKKRVWLAKGYGLFSERVADDTGNRNGAHDPEGEVSRWTPVASGGGYRRMHRS